MSEKLKPCPNCGGPVQMTGGTEWHDQHEFWIECRNKGCGCVRVGDTEREECVRRWNDLPRRLRWTNEKPTETGWYWYKDKVTKPMMCLVTTLDHQLIMNADRRYQNALIDKLDGEFDEKWAGPIPEPKDVK